MNKPIDHHYLPVFFVKRWAGQDRKVVEYRNWGKHGISDRRKYPTATGFETNLYKDWEITFFRGIDTDAADALAYIEKHGGGSNWKNERLRVGWVKFVFTLTLRSPEQMANLRNHFRNLATNIPADQRHVYDLMRKPDDPLTPEEWLANRPPEYLEDSPLRLIPQLTQSQEINSLLSSFHWFVLEIDPQDHALMTTENPVRYTGLERDDAYLVMPIGPRSAFWAVRDSRQEVVIRDVLRKKKTWVRDFNSDLVRGAHRLVIAHSTSAASFVRGNMSAEPVWASYQPIRPR